MLTLAKWFAALTAGVMLLLFAAFWWVTRENSFAPTPAQERSALFREMRAARQSLGEDYSVVASRQLPPGLPRHFAQAALDGAGFQCAGNAPQRCSLLLDRSASGRTWVSLAVWYVNDEVRTVQAQLQGVYL